MLQYELWLICVCTHVQTNQKGHTRENVLNNHRLALNTHVAVLGRPLQSPLLLFFGLFESIYGLSRAVIVTCIQVTRQ